MISIGEIVGRLLLHDELSPALAQAQRNLGMAAQGFAQLSAAAQVGERTMRPFAASADQAAASMQTASEAAKQLFLPMNAVADAANEAMGATGQLALPLEAVTAASTEASGAMGAAGDAAETMGEMTDQAANPVTHLKDELVEAVIAGNIFADWIRNTAVRMFNAGKESVALAARIQALGGVARYLGEQQGLTTKQVDDLAASLNRQGISLRQSNDLIIQFARANLDLGKAQQLAAVAQNAARIAGENSSVIVGRLIHGIVTMNQEVLRNAGIVLNMEESHKKAAKALGMTTNEMSGQQKQANVLNAVLEAGERITGVYGKTNEFVSGQVQSLERVIEDASAAVGERLIPVLEVATEVQTRFFKLVREAPDAFLLLASAITAMGGAIVGLKLLSTITNYLDGANAATKLFTIALRDNATGAINWSAVISRAAGAYGLAALIAGLHGVLGAMNETAQASEGFGNRMLDAVTKPFGMINDLWDAVTSGRSAVEVFELLAAATEKVGRPITNINAAIKILKQDTNLLVPEVDKLAESYDTLAESIEKALNAGKQRPGKALPGDIELVADASPMSRAIQAASKLAERLRTRDADYWKQIGSLSESTLERMWDLLRNNKVTAEELSQMLSKEKGFTISADAIERFAKEMEKSPAEEFAKKVKSITDNVKDATQEFAVFATAFGSLSAAQRDNLDVQNKLVPRIQEFAAAGHALTPAMQAMTAAFVAHRAAMLQQHADMLAGSGLTLELVASYQRAGMTLAEIADAYGVTTAALSVYIEKQKEAMAAQEGLRSFEEAYRADQAKQVQLAKDRALAHNVAITAAEKELALLEQQQQVSARDFEKAKAIQEITDELNAQVVAAQAAGRSSKEYEAVLNRIAKLRIDDVGYDQVVADFLVVNEAAQKLTDRLKAVDKAAADAAYEGLAAFFERLGNIAGPAGIGAVLRGVGLVVAGLAEARRMTEQGRTVLTVGPDGQVIEQFEKYGGTLGALSVAFNQSAKGADRMAAAFVSVASIAQGVMSIFDATQSSATRMGNAVNGALAGAQAGAFAGPMGIAIGAAAGLLVGLIRGKPAWARAAEEVGRDFGVKISEELARAIADQAKTLFSGDRFAASIFNLDKIIAEAGGLTEANFDQMAGRLRDVFVMLEKGVFSTAQAMEVLEKNWLSFVQAGTDETGRLSDALREVLALANATNTVTKSMRDYMQGQAGAAIALVNAVMGGSQLLFDQADEINQTIEQTTKEIAKLTDQQKEGKDVTKELAKAQDELTFALTRQHKMAEAAADELEDLGAIALNAFAVALATGASFAQALAAAQPGLVQLRKAYRDLGLDVEDATLKQLFMQSSLLENTPTLIQGVDALGGAITALGNINALTADSFMTMQQQGVRMYTRIQSEVAKLGGSTRDALIPMQSFLHAAAEEAERLGIPLDENTQMLIDQSKELGIWKDDAKTATQAMIDGINKIVETIEKLIRTIRGIPDDVPDPFRNWTQPTGPGERGGDGGGGDGGGSRGGGGDGGGPLSLTSPASATTTVPGALSTNGMLSDIARTSGPYVMTTSAALDARVRPAGQDVIVIKIDGRDRSPEEIVDEALRAWPKSASRNEHGIRTALLSLTREEP